MVEALEGAETLVSPSRKAAPSMSFNQRQRLFVEHYLLQLNASKAALAAGYSAHTARATGWKLLHHPKIAAEIKAAMAARAERNKISADRVLQELARIAFADLGNIAEWGPDKLSLKPNDGVALDDRVAIAELAIGHGPNGHGARIKLHSKHKALDSLARHLGLYERGAKPEMTMAEMQAMREKVRRMLTAKLDDMLDQRAAERATQAVSTDVAPDDAGKE
jgi:phage terminase small subunit